MAHTYDELKPKTVAELREIAAGIDHEALRGHTQLRKDELIRALCIALGIEMHHHHEVVGIEKTAVKGEIRELKKERDQALAARDHQRLREVRRRIKRLKRRIRRATV